MNQETLTEVPTVTQQTGNIAPLNILTKLMSFDVRQNIPEVIRYSGVAFLVLTTLLMLCPQLLIILLVAIVSIVCAMLYIVVSQMLIVCSVPANNVITSKQPLNFELINKRNVRESELQSKRRADSDAVPTAHN